jgi:hypothetical protein
MGAFDGVAAVVSDRAAGAAGAACRLVGNAGLGNGDGACAGGWVETGRAAGAPIGTSLVLAAAGGAPLACALWPRAGRSGSAGRDCGATCDDATGAAWIGRAGGGGAAGCATTTLGVTACAASLGSPCGCCSALDACTGGTAAGVGLRPGANGGTRVGVAERGNPDGGVSTPAPPPLKTAPPPAGARGPSAAAPRSARLEALPGGPAARDGAVVRLAAS